MLHVVDEFFVRESRRLHRPVFFVQPETVDPGQHMPLKTVDAVALGLATQVVRLAGEIVLDLGKDTGIAVRPRAHRDRGVWVARAGAGLQAHGVEAGIAPGLFEEKVFFARRIAAVEPPAREERAEANGPLLDEGVEVLLKRGLVDGVAGPVHRGGEFARDIARRIPLGEHIGDKANAAPGNLACNLEGEVTPRALAGILAFDNGIRRIEVPAAADMSEREDQPLRARGFDRVAEADHVEGVNALVPVINALVSRPGVGSLDPVHHDTIRALTHPVCSIHCGSFCGLHVLTIRAFSRARKVQKGL